jgi:O-antigen/teichoic acid export membrane protein
MADTTYRRQAREGVYWVMAARIASRGLGFVRMLIVYRIIMRSVVGVVNTADLVLNAIFLFQELGFSAALIYREDRIDEAADTTFWTVLASSCVLFLAAFFGAAPLLRLVSADPAGLATTVAVLRTLSLTLLISAFGQVPIFLMLKSLSFKRKVIPEVLSAAINMAVVIPLAVMGRGVWAIVYGRLAECASLSIMLMIVSGWRPRFRYSFQLAREMFDYARHIIGSQILIFFITNVDNYFISRFLGAYSLSGYNLAFNLSNTPATEVTRLFGQVMFPAFSKVKGDVAEMRAFFLRTTRYIGYISIPLAVCIFYFCDDFLRFSYADKFSDIVWPLRALVIYGVIRSIAANMGGIMKASGKPHWLFWIAAVRLTVMVGLLYPAVHNWGILGVAGLSAIVAVVDFIASAWLVNRIIHARVMDYVAMLVPPLLIAIAAGAVAKAAFPLLHGLKGFFSLPLIGAFMVGLYGLALLAVEKDARQMVLGVINDLVQRGRLALHLKAS